MTGKIGKFVAATASASLVCDMSLQAMTEGSVVVERAELAVPATEMVEGFDHETTIQDLVSSAINAVSAGEKHRSATEHQVSLDSIKPPLEFASEAWDPKGLAHRLPDPPYPCGR